jgi:hypothetical protein
VNTPPATLARAVWATFANGTRNQVTTHAPSDAQAIADARDYFTDEERNTTRALAVVSVYAEGQSEERAHPMPPNWFTDSPPATPDTVAALLVAQGLPATVEHPAHVRLALPYGVSLAIGTLNGPWEIDILAPDGDTASGGHSSIPASVDAGSVAQWIADQARDLSRRFVWAIGAYVEASPDMPTDLSTVLWDRQEGKPVLTLSDEYAQLICLEHGTRAPFTALEAWMNSAGGDALESEGIPATARNV